MPTMSRTSPSVTKPATPRLRAMPRRRSPVIAVAAKDSVAATITSPRRAAWSAPKTARLSAGPASQVIAVPIMTSAGGSSGLIR